MQILLRTLQILRLYSRIVYLSVRRKYPKIIYFRCDRPVTCNDMSVIIEWKVMHATTVQLEQVGFVPLKGRRVFNNIHQRKELKISATGIRSKVESLLDLGHSQVSLTADLEWVGLQSEMHQVLNDVPICLQNTVQTNVRPLTHALNDIDHCRRLELDKNVNCEEVTHMLSKQLTPVLNRSIESLKELIENNTDSAQGYFIENEALAIAHELASTSKQNIKPKTTSHEFRQSDNLSF